VAQVLYLKKIFYESANLIEVFLAVDENEYPFGGVTSKDYPISWTKKRGQKNVLYYGG
jgi:hypothetical protein